MMIKNLENPRFGDLISRRLPFKVPKYQRAYAWDDKEVDEFIADIDKLYKARLKTPPEILSHFFGGIVSIEEPVSGSYTGRVFNVVDGQQRLATFMLTVALLIHALETLSVEAGALGDVSTEQAAKSHAKATREKYLEYDEVINNQIQPRLRLSLSRADNDFFRDLLRVAIPAPTVTRTSHERLRNAWKLIGKKVINDPILQNTNLTLPQKLDHLLQLRNCLTEDCHLIFIVSESLSNAYRLFSTLNDRGKSLSDGDLLRSYTLELLEKHDQQQSRAEHCWDHILGADDGEIESFLRDYYPSWEGVRAPRTDLAEAFLKSFFPYPDGPLDSSNTVEAIKVENKIVNLEAEQEIYLDIAAGRWPYDNTNASDWQRLRLNRLVKTLRHTLCIPLLMSAYHNLDEPKFIALVLLLEKFVFRYISIVNAHAGTLGDTYNRFAKLIRETPQTFTLNTLRQELKILQDTHATDAAFTLGLEEQLDYQNTSSAKTLIRYFFSTLEDYYEWSIGSQRGDPRSEEIINLDLKRLTIEHIYPQNPTSTWIDPALTPYTHKIGNLSILGPGENSRIGNEPFANRKAYYGRSALRLNQEISRLPNWDEAVLLARRDELFARAKKIFTA
jgi:uncharacterized protein with ParB-like and HNH nuclease domain